jgi:hypothetical protein
MGVEKRWNRVVTPIDLLHRPRLPCAQGLDPSRLLVDNPSPPGDNSARLWITPPSRVSQHHVHYPGHAQPYANPMQTLDEE